jgi:hypothetical protein
MHPDQMLEMADQRGREMHARAREAGLARRVRRELRARRSCAKASDMLVMPQIPDYVDGSFRDTERAA